MKAPKTSTLKRLFAVSGNVCAFPECATALVDSDNVVGEVCHIKGNKPDSARHDFNQTEEERHGYENLILMCPTHHAMIDKDEKVYTVKKLLGYKAQHAPQPNSVISENDITVKQFIEDYLEKARSQSATSSEVDRLENKIRERSNYLLELQAKTLEPEALPQLISWIDDVKEDIARLKHRVNVIEPGRYKENEVTPPTNFHNLPQEAFFTGRGKDIDKVLCGLSSEERTWMVSIDGLGGIGKTSLAAHCSYLCRDERLFEEIIWVTAQKRQLNLTGIADATPSLVEFSDLLDEIMRAFKFSTPTEFAVEDKARIAKALLKQRHCLLVVDNFETLSDTAAITSFLRQTPFPTKTIVTSRRLFTMGEGERFIRLPPMSRPEGIELIQHTSKQKDINLSEEQIQSLFEYCSGIPAAIVWSVGRMVFTSPEIVLDDLKNFRNIEDLTEFCFSSALESLQSRNKDAAKAFLLLSLFPFPLTQEMLREILQNQNINNYIAVLEELNLLSLVKKEGDRITTLPIVRDFARNKSNFGMEINEKSARKDLARYISDAKNDGLIRVFTPTNEMVEIPAGATTVDFAYKIHTVLGNHFVSSTVNGSEADPSYRLEDGDRVEIVTHPSSTGPSLNSVVTERAKRIIRNRKRTSLRIIQPIRKGNTLSRNGAVADSIREYDLTISREPGNTWARNRRGQTLRLLGDLKGAADEYKTILTLSEADPFAYCGLGLIDYQKGWLDGAEKHFRRALESKPDYVNAMCGLGRTLCRQRNYPLAEEYLTDAIHLSIQLKDKTPWLHLYLFIALISQGKNKFVKADESLSTCLRQFFKRVGSRDNYRQVGSHTFYLYSIGLIFGNSLNYKNTLRKAVSVCAARGLREEIIADLNMTTLVSWNEWEAYALEKTSNPSLGIKPNDVISYLNNVANQL